MVWRGPDARWTLVIVAATAVVAVLAFRHLLDTIILALSLGIVLVPVHRRLQNRVPAGISAAALTLTVFLVLAGTAAGAGMILLQHQEYITGLIDQVQAWLAGQGTDSEGILTADLLRGWSKSSVESVSRSADALLGRAPLLTLEVVIFFISLYLFIVGGERAATTCMGMVPGTTVPALRQFFSVTSDTMYALYVVHVGTAALTFVLAVPFFWVLGYGHVLFFAFIAAVFQLIPLIGPTLLMVALVLIALSQGDLRGVALLVGVGYPVVCAFPDLWFRPVMMGRRASIHPALMWIGFFWRSCGDGARGVRGGPPPPRAPGGVLPDTP
ncbi:MAG: AI-2E family transporter [Methanomicrobiales archaeon]